MSNEADLYPKDAEELWDKIDGALGEGSQFHDAFGYYAQGVESTTAVLPKGWEGRLKRLQTPGTNDRIGHSISSSSACARSHADARLMLACTSFHGTDNLRPSRTKSPPASSAFTS